MLPERKTLTSKHTLRASTQHGNRLLGNASAKHKCSYNSTWTALFSGPSSEGAITGRHVTTQSADALRSRGLRWAVADGESQRAADFRWSTTHTGCTFTQHGPSCSSFPPKPGQGLYLWPEPLSAPLPALGGTRARNWRPLVYWLSASFCCWFLT